MLIHSKKVGYAFLKIPPLSMIVGDQKYLLPFLIQLLVEKYKSTRPRYYLKRLKAKSVNSLINLSTRNYIKAVKEAARGKVTQAIARKLI